MNREDIKVGKSYVGHAKGSAVCTVIAIENGEVSFRSDAVGPVSLGTFAMWAAQEVPHAREGWQSVLFRAVDEEVRRAGRWNAELGVLVSEDGSVISDGATYEVIPYASTDAEVARKFKEPIHCTLGLKDGQRILAREVGDKVFRTGRWDSVFGFIGGDGREFVHGVAEWYLLPFDRGY